MSQPIAIASCLNLPRQWLSFPWQTFKILLAIKWALAWQESNFEMSIIIWYCKNSCSFHSNSIPFCNLNTSKPYSSFSPLEYHLVNYHCGRKNCSPWQEITKVPLKMPNWSFTEYYHQKILDDQIKIKIVSHAYIDAWEQEESLPFLMKIQVSKRYLFTVVTDSWLLHVLLVPLLEHLF